MIDVLYGNHVLVRSLTWGTAAALIIGGTVFWSPEVSSLPGRLGVVIGNASYSIYLGSSLIMEFGTRAIQRLHRVDASSSLAWAALYQVVLVLMVLLSGWISYQFVEWPLIRHLQRRYTERQKNDVPKSRHSQAADAVVGQRREVGNVPQER